MQKPNLILNVDGVIAVSFVDLLRQSGAFTPLVSNHDIFAPYTLPFDLCREECQEYVDIGSLNGLFVATREDNGIYWYALIITYDAEGLNGKHSSTMLIILCFASGHYLDQKRLKQGLYRHPWDDISYISP